MYELTTAAGWSAIARGYLVLLLVGLPALAATGVPEESELEELPGARRVLYLSTVVSLGALALLTWAVAALTGLEGGDVGWRAAPPSRMALWTVGVSLAGLAVVWAITRVGQWLGASESHLVRFLLPRNRGERWGFALVSAVAGVGEEYLFRGFLLHGLADWTGSVWLSVGVVAVSFGVGHGYQRAVGVVRASVLGVLLALPVVFTGSLYPAIVGHFWINLAIGLGGWRTLVPPGEGKEIS